MLEGQTMGTSFSVQARCPVPMKAVVRRALTQVDEQMSTYNPESELNQFLAQPLDVWVAASANLFEVVRAANTVSEESSGAFDATIGPIVDLWGFGPGHGVLSPPTDQAISNALSRVGYSGVELKEGGELRRTQDVALDLSAIAKGFGVDLVGRELNRLDCADYLIEVGGELLAHGLNKRSQPWRIGIEIPGEEGVEVANKILKLQEVGVATSGDYRNYFVHEGRRYSHTFDPRTGKPVSHQLAAVTVVHASTMFADAYATAMSVMGPQQGYEFAISKGLPVMFVVRIPGEHESYETRYTPQMQAYLALP